jgi:hypothetical protein
MVAASRLVPVWCGACAHLDQPSSVVDGQLGGVILDGQDRRDAPTGVAVLRRDVEQDATQPPALLFRQLVELRREPGEHHAADAGAEDVPDDPLEAVVVDFSGRGEGHLQHRGDTTDACGGIRLVDRRGRCRWSSAGRGHPHLAAGNRARAGQRADAGVHSHPIIENPMIKAP